MKETQMKALSWLLLLIPSLLQIFFRKKTMTDTSAITVPAAQTPAAAQVQTQLQAPAPTLANAVAAIGEVAQVAALIPGAGAIANTVAETAQTVEAVAPAVDSVLTALLPLLIAAGHNIGAEWEHLVGAAKTVAK